MVAVVLSAAAFDAVWLACALAMAGALGAFAGPRSRRLLAGLLMVGVVAYGVVVAQAVYVPCPWEWRWLGLC